MGSCRLSPSQLSCYRRDGLVVAPYRLDPTTVERLGDAASAVIAANPHMPPDRLINVHLSEFEAETVSGDAAFHDLAHDPTILDLVEQVLGPDVILWLTHMFAKPAGVGREVPWHQDSHYWPIRPMAACSVWVAVDDVDLDNGAMRYIAGSHATGAYRHHYESGDHLTIKLSLDPGQVDEGQARHNTLAAGEMSLHDARLVHGSAPNRSPRRRVGIVLRYMSAASLFDRSAATEGQRLDYSRVPLFLVRGVDRHGGNDFGAGK